MRRIEEKVPLNIESSDGCTKTYIYTVQRSYKHYFNSAHQFARITKGERLYYDYLCEMMDDHNNLLVINNQFNTKFCKLLSEWTSGKIKVSVKSIPKFISHLVEANLIHPYRTSKRELYQINPKYAYRGAEHGRKKLIKDELRHRINKKLPFAHLIDCSQEEFLMRGKKI